ncbi:MAG: hypothetical protein COB20_08795 [SAR86 cluster bacterium]|uniref:Lipoprotein n=1 Tax=SAR86 cluster bacterium TaxID=2030880 RepID=A0A2A4X3D7_9GAMM|nr:MAG: hypothetical protein COB20_08795 [SAR86 cluster bacterium]
MKKLKTLAALLATVSLTSCSLPGLMSLGDAQPGEVLMPGETTALQFFTNIPNFDTEIGLQEGVQYELKINLLSNWLDSTIDRNENKQTLDQYGFADSVMPIPAVSLLKRSREHNWFELMLLQPNCKRSSLVGISDLTFDEASGSYNFVATCDGKLTLFVNDSHGFYSNNSGFASISLSRV